MKSENFRLIIKKEGNIKSRQWWTKKTSKIVCTAAKYLPKTKRLLIQQSEFSIVITNNKEIKSLNNRYRKMNRPTDVLSFPLNKSEQKKNRYLGDIIISTKAALENAKKNKINLETEILMLLIHGYLHLLGYKHKIRKDAKVMFSLQNKILTEVTFY